MLRARILAATAGPSLDFSSLDFSSFIACSALMEARSGQYDDGMDLSFSETGFLFFLALLLFGPKKLPEIGRQIGKALNEFKRASNEFRSQIEAEIATLERDSEPTPQILPPTRAPEGAIASGTLVDLPAPASVPEAEAPMLESPSPETESDSGSMAKAPDA